jgi:transposase
MSAVGLQTVRDWVLRFNAEGPEGLLTGKAPGARPLLNPEQRQALERIIEEGPIPSIHGVVRWRLVDLVQWVWEEFRITISQQTLSRELRSLHYRKLSARPRHHAKNEAEVDAFKKPSRLVWRRSRPVRLAAGR